MPSRHVFQKKLASLQKKEYNIPRQHKQGKKSYKKKGKMRNLVKKMCSLTNRKRVPRSEKEEDVYLQKIQNEYNIKQSNVYFISSFRQFPLSKPNPIMNKQMNK